MLKADVVILGLGYVGLPTAALIASKKTFVHGVDINEKIINGIKNEKIHINEPGLNSLIIDAKKLGFFECNTFPIKSKVYIVTVPTPLKKNNKPDISYIKNATKSIIDLLEEDDLYIIESTSPVGTTEKMMNYIYKKRPDLKDKLFISYCPERVLPGNAINEMINNDRVIGGINKISTKKTISFYKKFIKGVLLSTNAKTAEMCKLIENSSRDLQISFANELSIICDEANINVWELINLANKHPRVNILNPGPGVGGHCIAIDPQFIISDFPKRSKIIKQARKINNYKSRWCIQKIMNTINDFKNKNHIDPVIAIMGLTFKPNINDLRESPSEKITRTLISDYNLKNYHIVDPHIEEYIYPLSNIKKALDKSDIIIFLVAHKLFDNIKIKNDQTILDFCGIIDNKIST